MKAPVINIERDKMCSHPDEVNKGPMFNFISDVVILKNNIILTCRR